MNQKQHVKIGQMFQTVEDIENHAALSEEKVLIKAGTEFWIGADHLAHYRNGMIQPIDKNEFDFDGYDSNGLAVWLWLWIRTHTCVNKETLAEYDMTPQAFVEELVSALDELGF